MAGKNQVRKSAEKSEGELLLEREEDILTLLRRAAAQLYQIATDRRERAYARVQAFRALKDLLLALHKMGGVQRRETLLSILAKVAEEEEKLKASKKGMLRRKRPRAPIRLKRYRLTCPECGSILEPLPPWMETEDFDGYCPSCRRYLQVATSRSRRVRKSKK